MVISSYSEIYKQDSSLRPYQQKAKKEIFESWDEVDSVMFQMPTGTGKTRLFTSIISDINKYSIQRREAVKILIIAHRTELIDQIDKSLDKYHVAHNIIAGGRERNIKYPVSVASIQTITNARNLKDAKKLKVQFVIIDEAHHALASSYKKLWDLYPDAKRLGVTATPWRMNHQTFTDLFDKLVLSMPIKDFIKQGYLAPYKYFSLKSDSNIQRTIDDIELDRFGEYKESSMEEKMDIGSIRAQLLDSYLSLAEGKKGIIYAINIAHANHICKEYEKAGYNAVSIDSKTPAAVRKELVNKFKKSEIDIIVNVDIFSEGFDCPDIEFIQLARPTRSLVKYLQQVGRGLRPTENKQNCVILDNVGMYSRFGLPDARRHWKYHFLGKKVDEEPVKVVSKGTGKSRYVDLSEGTEDMELIQDIRDEVEIVDVPNEESSSQVNDFFPLFGVTLGKTTWQQVENMGYEVKIWKKGPARYTVINNVMFWDYNGTGIFTSIYWTMDDCDFPLSWKSRGFAWDVPYSDWVDVFNKLGYKVEGDNKPTNEKGSKDKIFEATLEACSPDNTLSFELDFQYEKNGSSNISLESLSSVFVYCNALLENTSHDNLNNIADEPLVNPSEISKNTEIFDPMPMLLENNYKDNNFIFWFNENERVYESYLHDDTYYIVSELLIDKTKHRVNRNRVGKISKESWMGTQLEKEEVSNLKSINHIVANFTVFHYQNILPNGTVQDEYYDYRGRKVGSPDIVEAKYLEAKRGGELHDYINVTVSKADFKVEVRKNLKEISIYRQVKGVIKHIAGFPFLSDFGYNYFGLNNKEIRVLKKDKESYKKLNNFKSSSCYVYSSDYKTIRVRCYENDKITLYYYDYRGSLINKASISDDTQINTSLLAKSEIDKLWHVFDKKATSYKYFWFWAILKIYKETKASKISFDTILVNMVSIAWKYVFDDTYTFPSIDQLPTYLRAIQIKAYLHRTSKENAVKESVQEYYKEWKWDSLLKPLLNNVPYRFLSPWIPFTSNEDVIEKSNEQGASCLYSIQKNQITINPMWEGYLIDNYYELLKFIEKELFSFLKRR